MVLQERVTRITFEARHAVLFVTHGIEEAVLPADRLMVIIARPGGARPEPRPRRA
jgi:ABC-type nitrate/sulfonate/bicarbonate transport system ATPase subunit